MLDPICPRPVVLAIEMGVVAGVGLVQVSVFVIKEGIYIQVENLLSVCQRSDAAVEGVREYEGYINAPVRRSATMTE